MAIIEGIRGSELPGRGGLAAGDGLIVISDIDNELEAVTHKMLATDFLNDVNNDIADILDTFSTGTYTPGLTGITLGSGGTNTGRYTHVAGMLTIDGQIILGTGFSIGDTQIDLPAGFQYEASVVFNPVGRAVFYDVGVGRGHGVLYQADANSATFQVMNASSTFLVGAALGSTAPFTWVAGDQILWQIHARVISV